MPGKPDTADKLYQRLMQMQEQTFRDRRFEVSSHLLAAAVHAAEELKSATRARIAADAAVGRIRERAEGAD